MVNPAGLGALIAASLIMALALTLALTATEADHPAVPPASSVQVQPEEALQGPSALETELDSEPSLTVVPVSPREEPASAAPLIRQRLRVWTPAGWTWVHLLRVRLDALQIAVGLPPQGVGTRASLTEIARVAGAWAAINANFYDPRTGLPIGLLIHEGRLLRRDFARRGALLSAGDGRPVFARVGAQPYLYLETRRSRVPLDAVNRPPLPDGLVLYTPEYAAPIALPAGALAWQVRNGRVIRVLARSVIEPDGQSHFLVGTGAARQRLGGLGPGDVVRFDHELGAGLEAREAVSAGPLLLQGGRLVLDPARERFEAGFARGRAARSAVAWTDEGELLLVVALKDASSAGLTLEELAHLLQVLGAREALALDGGGSAGLAFRQDGRLQVVGGGRRIAVALLLLPRFGS